MRRNVINTINERVDSTVGGWCILSYAGVIDTVQTAWGKCCHCSAIKQIRWGNILRKGSNGCGCLRKVRLGVGQTPESQAYTDMLHRCGGNPKWAKRRDAQHWEGRGITVCGEWKKSFKAFIEHVGLRPTPKHTLDRVDNDKGYEPGNVRWATRTQQARNRRSNEYLTFRGETLCMAEMAEKYGLKLGTLHARLRYSGWSVRKALTTPVNNAVLRKL